MSTVWLLAVLVPYTVGQLVIQVSRGKEDSVAYRQALVGNTTADTVTIDYVTPEGVGITVLEDFKTGLTITRAIVLGEQDLGQARCASDGRAGDAPGQVPGALLPLPLPRRPDPPRGCDQAPAEAARHGGPSIRTTTFHTPTVTLSIILQSVLSYFK